ncbi:MAG: hypothetical protein DWQ44_08625 [Bacteroidetes bacterium]|nr:MAG: hypothetical protein DWQ33_02025 [Bacteroidota bacterium]REK06963.1 MAG: hypothetical protein DWQ39_02065 [Bacteroidota bacterium]REK33689.1 MAG: hypothetical protein DWQ44_08625 [Bacteroidota bacterium]REK47234.1 MAG: hypothetical protein DWQ48_13100 [Bacteroidota bacterium]
MNTTKIITLFLLLSSAMIYPFKIQAQDRLDVSESQEMMSQNMQNGFGISIPKAKIKDVEKAWKKYVKKESKASLKENEGEYSAMSCVIPAVSTDTCNLYTRFNEADNAVRMFAFLEVNDRFISSSRDSEKTTNFKFWIRNFALEQYREAVEDELKTEKRNLDKMEGDLKSFEKEISSAEDRIRKNNREIERLRSEIETLRKEQAFTNNEILKQKQMLTTFLGSAEQRKVEEKRLKDMEKEYKRSVKKDESAHRKIDKLEDEIKKLDKEIDKNKKKEIPDKKDEINAQKLKVKNVEDLLSNIR